MSSSNDESIMASSSVKLYQTDTSPSVTSTSIPSPETLPGYPLNYPPTAVGGSEWVLVLALIMFYQCVVGGSNRP